MSTYAEHVAIGVIIRGCPDPEGVTLSAPVLWTNRDVQSISAPTGNLATCTFRGRIKSGEAGVDGFAHQVSLQDLLSSGGQIKLKLTDRLKTVTRLDLGQLFAPDPVLYATKRWQVKSTYAALEKADVTFDLVGPNLTVNDIIWVENEAMKVTATTVLLPNLSSQVTVTRGVLGSRVRKHTIKPSLYPGNSDGRECGLYATSRPEWDRYAFEVELYYFTLDGNTATVAEFWPRMTEGRPLPEGVEGQGQEWGVNTVDVIGWLSKRKSKKRSSIKLSHAIQIKSFATGNFVEFPPTVPDGFSMSVPGNYPPSGIRVFCTVYEAEKFFNVRFRLPFSDTPDQTTVDAFSITLCSYPAHATRKLVPEIVAKVGGYEWTFRAQELGLVTNGPTWNTALGRQYVWIDAKLWDFIQESGKAACCNDNPCPGYPKTTTQTINLSNLGLNLFVGPGWPALQVGQVTSPKRPPTLNMGWTLKEEDPIRTSLGEEQPEIRLRFILDKVRPIEQLLMLLLSGHGGGNNHATYDIIPTELCPEVDSSFLYLGTTSLTPNTNDSRTKELLKLDQLLSFVEVPPLDVDNFDLGAAIRRILRANSLIASYVAEGLTFRQLSGFFNVAPTAVKQVTGAGRLINAGQRLQAMKSLTVKGGHHPITLKPGWEQPIYLLDGGDIEQGEAVDVYPVGGALTPEQWISGPFAQLIRVTFLMQRGSPPVYKVPTKRQRGAIYVGDLVSWSDLSIVGPQGRGTQSTRTDRWVVVGRDVNPWNGDQAISLIQDSLNNIQTQDGQIGNAYLIDKISFNATSGNYSFLLKALGGSGNFDPLDLLTALWENSGYVRILSEHVHNPNQGLGTRPGYLECYGQLAAAAFIWDNTGADAYATVDVFVDTSFTALGFDPLLMRAGKSYFCIADYRSSQTSALGAEIGPVDAFNNCNIAILGAGDGVSGMNLAQALPVFDS